MHSGGRGLGGVIRVAVFGSGQDIVFIFVFCPRIVVSGVIIPKQAQFRRGLLDKGSDGCKSSEQGSGEKGGV